MSLLDVLINGVLIVCLITLIAVSFAFSDKPNQQGVVVMGTQGVILILLLYMAGWQHRILSSQQRVEKLLHVLFGGDDDVRIGLEGSVQYLRNRIAEHWQEMRRLNTTEETHDDDDVS